MSGLNKLSIRQKIISIILSITIISTITVFAIDILNDIRSSKKELQVNVTIYAKFLVDYLIPTFRAEDQEGVKNILQKIVNNPSITYGALYDTNGVLNAEYCPTGSPYSNRSLPEILKSAQNKKELIITESLIWQDKKLGTLLLVPSTDFIQAKTKDNLKLMLLILLISIAVGTILTFWLERIISGPIIRLVSVTRNIQKSLDYSIRVKKESFDETGTLYDAFNDMLQSIEDRKKERDIAEWKLIEERENLETRVLERTKELNAAKEKAEESDKLKSAFLANMSHEIRTPLNAILGFSSLIQNTSPSPNELEEYYKMMETSGNDLVNLIDDILDISRIEANQVKINIQETPVRHLAEEVFSTFKQSLLSENKDNLVTPVFDFPPEDSDYVLNTDPHRLKQILLNILNNAIKFTLQGSIEFCYFPNDAKTHLVFCIKDTGIGIEKDQQKKIFERFTKVADIKTKHYRGTGLGLSIALKLTQLLNGEIRVESELNVGTVFYLTFPLSKEIYPVADQKNKPKDESLTFLSGKIILIAEDVEYNYRYLAIVLNKNLDVKIIWAKNGIEAIDFIEKNPKVSIVLMDIQLPEMNGLDATRIIKSKHKNLPVIAQTAYVTPFDIEECHAAGCIDVLMKPIKKSTLIEALRKYIMI